MLEQGITKIEYGNKEGGREQKADASSTTIVFVLINGKTHQKKKNKQKEMKQKLPLEEPLFHELFWIF